MVKPAAAHKVVSLRFMTQAYLTAKYKVGLFIVACFPYQYRQACYVLPLTKCSQVSLWLSPLPRPLITFVWKHTNCHPGRQAVQELVHTFSP